jgi:oligopeptidase B
MGGKLRELKTDDNLLLLCTDMDSGTAVNPGALKAMKGWRWSMPF